MAKQLEKAGAHVLGLKDMAGVCKPRAARELVRVLKQEIGLPIHFHTHDTSGIAAASVLARSEEHTSELQSLMRISYAVFCLQKKKKHPQSSTVLSSPYLPSPSPH